MMMTMAIIWVISSHLHVFAGAAALAWRNQCGTRGSRSTVACTETFNAANQPKLM